MSTLSISAAARATGVHRVTMQKYVKDGKISVTKDGRGNPQIDVAELIRVFGPLKSDGNTDNTSKVQLEQQEATPGSIAAETAVEALREQLKAALEREKWLQAQLEKQQERYEILERKMLPPGEPEKAGEPGPGEEPKKGFLRRLFG